VWVKIGLIFCKMVMPDLQRQLYKHAYERAAVEIIILLTSVIHFRRNWLTDSLSSLSSINIVSNIHQLKS
jgi:hypothetical protein